MCESLYILYTTLCELSSYFCIKISTNVIVETCAVRTIRTPFQNFLLTSYHNCTII
nr:MAG TPA: hypothetical protein [Caudoviricetes sp.]